MDNNGDDLEYREERSEPKLTPKKIHIPLKLKSAKTPISVKLSPSLQKTSKAAASVSEKTLPSTTVSQAQAPVLAGLPTPNELSITSTKPIVDVFLPEVTKNVVAQPNPMILENPQKRTHAISNLNWNLNNSSSSQKISDHTMDYCLICNLPILIYGRLIPCKHVMCLQCAHSIDIKVCLKEQCNERIERIEKANRGNIFVCLNDMGASNIELIRQNPDVSQKKLCGRSYMSQRDLNSHIQHRHEAALPNAILMK